MIEAYKFSTYLKSKGLRAEEFWALYRVMILEQNAPDGNTKVSLNPKVEAFNQFSRESREYNDWINTSDDPIDWVKMYVQLEEKGFVEIWTRKDDTIEMRHLKVTDKFKEDFLVDSVEEALHELIAVYPKMVRIEKDSKKFPSVNMMLSDLAKLYDELILKGGNKFNHYRCLEITKLYLEDMNIEHAPMNLEKYIKQFEGIALAYESNDEGSKDAKEDEFYDDL